VADKPTITDMMVAYGQDAVDMARNNFSETLDYSERSVETVERCLGKLHDSLPKGFFGRLLGRGPSADEIHTVAKMFGGYIGEVFRKHHGGDWVLEPDETTSVPALTVVCPDGGRFFPPAKAHKRIVNGQEDNVWGYYQVLTGDAGEPVAAPDTAG
jgi:hypothetical protein